MSFHDKYISICCVSLRDHSGYWQEREAHSARVLKVFNEGTTYRHVGGFEEARQEW